MNLKEVVKIVALAEVFVRVVPQTDRIKPDIEAVAATLPPIQLRFSASLAALRTVWVDVATAAAAQPSIALKFKAGTEAAREAVKAVVEAERATPTIQMKFGADGQSAVRSTIETIKAVTSAAKALPAIPMRLEANAREAVESAKQAVKEVNTGGGRTVYLEFAADRRVAVSATRNAIEAAQESAPNIDVKFKVHDVLMVAQVFAAYKKAYNAVEQAKPIPIKFNVENLNQSVAESVSELKTLKGQNLDIHMTTSGEGTPENINRGLTGDQIKWGHSLEIHMNLNGQELARRQIKDLATTIPVRIKATVGDPFAKLKADAKKAGDFSGEEYVQGFKLGRNKLALVITTLVAAALPAIGAAIGAAVITGIATAGIGVALAIAFQNPGVKAAATDLGTHLKNELVSAAAPMTAEIRKAIPNIGAAFSSLKPQLSGIFANLVPQFDTILAGLLSGIKNIMPGISAAIAAAKPFADALGQGLALLGTDIGDLFRNISANSKGPLEFFRAAILATSGLIKVFGYLVSGLGQIYSKAIDVSKGVTDAFVSMAQHIEPIVASLAKVIPGFDALDAGLKAAISAGTSYSGVLGQIANGLDGATPKLQSLGTASATAAQQGLTLKSAFLTAVQTMKDYQDAAHQAAITTGRSMNAAAQGVKDSIRAVAAAVQGVKDAQLGVKDAIHGVETATQGVAHAKQAVKDAIQGVAAAIQGVAHAKQAVTDAIHGVTTAAQGIIHSQQAIKDATHAVNEAIRGVAAAKQAVTDAIQSAADAVRGVAAAKQAVTDAIQSSADALRGIDAAKQAVTDAIQSETDTLHGIDAAKQAVTDAIQGVIDAQHGETLASRATADAIKAVGTAERALIKDHEDEQKAQDDLTDARKEAAQTLKDLTRQERDNSNSVEAAAIALGEANIAQALSGTVKGLEYRKAVLAQKEAQNSYNDALQNQIDTRTKLDDATQKGIEGDQKVIDAKKKISDAAQQTIDDEDALTKVKQAQTEAELAQAAAKRATEAAQRSKIDADLAETAAERQHEAALRAVTDAKLAEAAAVRQHEAALRAEADAREAESAAERNEAAAKRAVEDARHAESEAERNEAAARRDRADAITAEKEAENNYAAALRNEADARLAEKDAERQEAAARRSVVDAKVAEKESERNLDAAKRGVAAAERAKKDAEENEAAAKRNQTTAQQNYTDTVTAHRKAVNLDSDSLDVNTEAGRKNLAMQQAINDALGALIGPAIVPPGNAPKTGLGSAPLEESSGWMKSLKKAVDDFTSILTDPVVKFFKTTVPDLVGGVWDSIKKKWDDVWDNAKTSHTKKMADPLDDWFIKTVPGLVSGLWEKIKTDWNKFWDKAHTSFTDKMVDPLHTWFTVTVPTLFGGIWDDVKERWKKFWDDSTRSFDDNHGSHLHTWFTVTLPTLFAGIWEDVKVRWKKFWDNTTTSFNDNLGTPIHDWFKKTVPGFFSGIWDDVKADWKKFWDNVKLGWNTAIVDPMSNWFTKTLPGFFTSMGTSIKGIWTQMKIDAAEGLNDVIDKALNPALAKINAVTSKFGVTIKPIDDIPVPAAPKGKATPPLMHGLSQGGYLQGPGTETSDSIPIMGSRGEFMHNARAVAHYGLDFMRGLNDMTIPKLAAGGSIDEIIAVGKKSGLNLGELTTNPSGYHGSPHSDNGGYHSSSQAVDFGGGGGVGSEEAKIAQWWKANFGAKLLEEIWTPPNGYDGIYIKNGKINNSVYDTGTKDGHRNHVHIAAEEGFSKGLFEKIVDSVGNFISDTDAAILNTAMKPFLDALGGDSIYSQMGKGILQNVITSVLSGGGSDGGGGDTDPKGSAQAYAKSILDNYGWGPEQFGPLQKLWERESNWNYKAYNSNGGATGIPQALPGNKMASEGADWRTNPKTQIKWGLGYIKGRYGNPAEAWSQDEGRHPHWYDTGGYLKDDGIAINTSGHTEAVLNPEETANFKKLTANSSLDTDRIADLLEDLIDAVNNVAPGVGDSLRGTGRSMVQKARSL